MNQELRETSEKPPWSLVREAFNAGIRAAMRHHDVVLHANQLLWTPESERAFEAFLRERIPAEADGDVPPYRVLPDLYDKRHLPGCRKEVYDPKSSPCTCVSEWERLLGDAQRLEEQLKTAEVRVQRALAFARDQFEARLQELFR